VTWYHTLAIGNVAFFSGERSGYVTFLSTIRYRYVSRSMVNTLTGKFDGCGVE